MTDKKIIYYLIRNRILGKEENGLFFLFEKGEWLEDKKSVILDYLHGYDPNDTSPYGMYNMDIMDKIDEIDEERALQIMKEQTPQ